MRRRRLLVDESARRRDIMLAVFLWEIQKINVKVEARNTVLCYGVVTDEWATDHQVHVSCRHFSCKVVIKGQLRPGFEWRRNTERLLMSAYRSCQEQCLCRSQNYSNQIINRPPLIVEHHNKL